MYGNLWMVMEPAVAVGGGRCGVSGGTFVEPDRRGLKQRAWRAWDQLRYWLIAQK